MFAQDDGWTQGFPPRLQGKPFELGADRLLIIDAHAHGVQQRRLRVCRHDAMTALVVEIIGLDATGFRQPVKTAHGGRLAPQ